MVIQSALILSLIGQPVFAQEAPAKKAEGPAPKVSQAKRKKPEPPPPIKSTTKAEEAPRGPKVLLAQADVARLVLEKSDRSTEANLQAEIPRLELAKVETQFDWTLSASTGYDIEHPAPLNQIANLKNQSWLTSVSLSKSWMTGTKTTLEWNRNSLQADFNPAAGTTNFPSHNTRDAILLTVSQDLLRNYFGATSRNLLEGNRKKLQAAQTKRGFNLQNLVLEGLRLYWDAYVAEQNLKEALRAREAYQKLVENVRRKSGYGYAGGGELSQAQAEYETRVQNVKKASIRYLQSEDELLAYLNLPPGSEIEFKIENEIPVPPKLEPVVLENLREFRAQQLAKESADNLARSARADNNLGLALVGKVGGAGVDQNSATSFGNSISGSNPHYYMGVELTHTFGSNFLGETQLNSELLAKIEEIKTNRLKVDLQIRLSTQEKYVQSAYAVVVSAKDQKNHRERALREIQQYYNQGRVQIRDLITAMNDAFQTEVTYSQSVGDYQNSLANWAAWRDELIPDSQVSK